MATKKRKSTKRRTAARRKKAEQRLPAGLGTLFGGLLLMVLAFVIIIVYKGACAGPLHEDVFY